MSAFITQYYASPQPRAECLAALLGVAIDSHPGDYFYVWLKHEYVANDYRSTLRAVDQPVAQHLIQILDVAFAVSL